jgi:ribonuclease T1
LLFQGKPVFRTGWASSGSQKTGHFRQALHKWGAAVVVASGLAVGAVPVSARSLENPASLKPVALVTLPVEAQQTHRLILAGGPFPYSKDGTVFGNRERLLPPQARGYYREYTVKTPGARNRGARRIVCGGKPPTQPEACYYTADHYASFRRITP